MDDVFSALVQYAVPHWPFVFMSFALGTVGQFFKKKVWTFERAVRGGEFWAIMHHTLGIHAPVVGALAGALGMPASPGVEGPLARALYHFVAGAMAAWTVAAFKHFMKSRGIVLAESMAPPSSLAMPSSVPFALDNSVAPSDPPPCKGSDTP
jgi:putative flippase GtrA